MTASIALRVGRTVPLVALLLGLLTACAAGPFKMQLEVPNPATVGYLYVLFGKDGDLATEKTEGGEVEALILPSKLKSYVGYAEYALRATEAVPEWRELGKQLPEQIELVIPEDSSNTLRIKLNRRLLKLHPGLAVAVVVRNPQNEYVLGRWPSSVVAESKGTLKVQVTADSVTGIVK
jgi:hypothetical protein